MTGPQIRRRVGGAELQYSDFSLLRVGAVYTPMEVIQNLAVGHLDGRLISKKLFGLMRVACRGHPNER